MPVQLEFKLVAPSTTLVTLRPKDTASKTNTPKLALQHFRQSVKQPIF